MDIEFQALSQKRQFLLLKKQKFGTKINLKNFI